MIILNNLNMDNTTLQAIQNRDQIVLFLRHGERYKIKTMEDALGALLTDNGKAASYNLGKELAHIDTFNLYHSPIPRCEQTAFEIHKGLNTKDGNSTVTGPLLDLGGPYVKGDWRELSQMVDSMGQSAFLRIWFDGDIPETKMMPLEKAAQNQCNIIRDQLKKNSGSAINITHDWNIMIVREYFFNLKHEDIDAPGFLDGIAAFWEGSRMVLFYNGNAITIDSEVAST